MSFNAPPPPPLALPLHVVLQDRRAPRTAAFIVTTTGYVGACVLSPATDGWGGLTEGPLPGLTDALAFDGGGSFGLGAANHTVEYLWGRADARVVSVRIQLGNALGDVDDDDRVVTASVGDGYWLGWWPARIDRPWRPGDNQATVISGFDAQGNFVGALEHTINDGWVMQ